ncbi:hypothetical protein HMPREF0290_2142 [Corynebacterium efficiens YS-314]|nr:hypothetical protein HMPREF0290_2142 [Corynebacterium efficiens YS-314]
MNRLEGWAATVRADCDLNCDVPSTPGDNNTPWCGGHQGVWHGL